MLPLTICRAAAVFLLLAGCANAGGAEDGTLQVSGSTTVNPVAADAAEALRGDGLRITVDTQGGSAGGLAQLGAGEIDIAMSSKPVGEEDRAQFPNTDFVARQIGADAVGVIVRREVYDGGVRSLTKDQARQLFEGRIANWSQLGGPDLPVFIYDKEPGRGTREVLDTYLYGDGEAPPPPDSDLFAIVGGNEETRSKLLSTPGSVGPLSTAFVDGVEDLAALALDGTPPTPDTIQSGAYPMARPLFLVTDGTPTGDPKRFIDYVLSAPGQQLLVDHGYLPLAALSGP